MCGSGNGAQITANKYSNVRAGLCWNEEQAMLIKLHNNANILSLPGRFVSMDEALKIVEVFYRQILKVEDMCNVWKKFLKI